MKNLSTSESLLGRHPVDYIISDVLNVDIEDITDDLAYQKCYQWSSVQHVELILSLEKEFQVPISSEDVLFLNSVKKIRTWVDHLNVKNKENNATDFSLDIKKVFTGKHNEKHESVYIHKVQDAPNIYRGLNEIYFDTTQITWIDNENGMLKYRGFPIEDILKKFSYEEFIFLMLYNKLPSKSELNVLCEEIQSYQCLPQKVIAFIEEHIDACCIDVLKCSLSILSLHDHVDYLTIDSQMTGLNVLVKSLMIIGYHFQKAKNQQVVFPDQNASIGYIEYFIWLLRGEQPAHYEIDVFKILLVYLADHGSNSSTFAARIATGAQTDIYSALISAISIFKGAAHGGVIANVLHMIDAIKSPKNVAQYIKNKRNSHQTIPGFGHRVHRKSDPRCVKFKSMAFEFCSKNNDMNDYLILQEIEKEMQDLSLHGIIPNVDLYPGLILRQLKFSNEFSIVFYVIARMLGWISHINEQMKNNILIRPRLFYVGNHH